jgi:SAM-dependent methyltransferase
VDRARRLEDGPAATAPPPQLHGAAHASRSLADRFLRSGAGDAAAVVELHRIYADEAETWSAWAESQPDYLAPLRHALTHLPPRPIRRVTLEVAAGTGQATALLAGTADAVLATDAVAEMVRRGAARVPGVTWAVADAARLPVRDGTVDLVVCCNAVFALAEAERVLADDGVLLVVSSFAEMTPIRHAPQGLLDLLPAWTMTWARAAHGEWAMFRRVRATRSGG